MKNLLVVFLILFTCFNCQAITRVACVGASITYGATVVNRQQNSFPAQLQHLLGAKYLVNNFGVSGTTLLRKGDFSYWGTKEYQQALKYNPDVVFIDLGGNDSKLVNRIYLNQYSQDCKDMIKAFRSLPSHPRVILMQPVVSFVTDTTGIWDAVIVNNIIPQLRQVARDEQVELLDMHSLLINRPDLFPDKIHPNAEGCAIMGKRLYQQAILKWDTSYNIFSKVKEEYKTSSFYGYNAADFMLNGRNCKIVQPLHAAKGHPWVWRARFWGHEPQTDIALLERGYHVVYCDVAELFGNEQAIAYWDAFYNLLIDAGLSKKAVMEGMSRGAVYVLNWAAINPQKVACVYIDNPVLDLKSWPAGMGKVQAAPVELKQLKQDYNLQTDAQLRNFNGSPIDKVSAIFKGGYPILILCADADEAVPPKENTYLFEKMALAQGGKITVLHKPGFKHHPHSLPNPSPIVDFILQAAN